MLDVVVIDSDGTMFSGELYSDDVIDEKYLVYVYDSEPRWVEVPSENVARINKPLICVENGEGGE